MSKKVQHMASLLVGGIMIGYICSAITDFVVTFADDSDIVNLHGWSQGSFSGMSWSNITLLRGCRTCGAVYIFPVQTNQCISIGRSICAEYGSQHQDVSRDFDFAFQYSVSVCDSICRTDFFRGNRSSVSCKEAFGTSKPIVVIPGTFFMGAVFCMICDLIARMALAPVELNISTVTSILGAPIVIYMMIPKGGEKIRWQIIIFK